MLVTLLVVTYTGLKVYGEEGHGPMAASAEFSLISPAKAEELSHSHCCESVQDRAWGCERPGHSKHRRCSSYSTGHIQLYARSLEVEPFFPELCILQRASPGAGMQGGSRVWSLRRGTPSHSTY